MIVAAVLQQYPPRTTIGAYLATHRWLVGLTERGHQVTVYRTSHNPRGLREHVDGVISLPPPGRSLWDDKHPWREADVIVSHIADKPQRDTAHRAALQLKIPSVRIAHSVPTDRHTPLVGAALLIVNSQATADGFGDWGGPTVVCHPPTFPDDHRTTPGRRVTQVNLQERKGGHLFWKLVAELPDVDFLAVDGWGEQIGPNGPLVTTIPHTLPDNVRWQQNTRDMRGHVWADTRLLLMPSEKEAWGMVAVEAMTSGIPVIAHPTPGLVESLGGAGVLVDRDDVGGWIDAIRSLDDPAVWLAASARALGRVAALDPQQSINRFCDAVEKAAR